MKQMLLATCLLLVWTTSALAQAETPAPPGPSAQDAPPGRPGPAPPGGNDAAFFLAQAMQAMAQKAEILMKQGKSDAAIQELEKAQAVQIPPDTPRDHPVRDMKAQLLGRLAMAYCEAGRTREALDSVKQLLAGVPAGSAAEAGAWLDAGSIYKCCGKLDEALQAFDHAIALSQELARSGRRSPPGPPGGRPPGPKNPSNERRQP